MSQEIRHGVGVMRTDSGIEHGAATARPNHPEIAGTIGKGGGQAHCDEKKGEGLEFHRLLPALSDCGLVSARPYES